VARIRLRRAGRSHLYGHSEHSVRTGVVPAATQGAPRGRRRAPAGTDTAAPAYTAGPRGQPRPACHAGDV